MPLLDDLNRLARVPRSTTPFLSLYLDTRWTSEKQREQVRIFVKTRLKACLTARRGDLPVTLREDADKLTHYVRGLVNREWDEDCGGVAVFACGELGVYRLVRSHLPFPAQLACADRPLLRPAAEHLHAGRGGLVAVVTAAAGRLLEFAQGRARLDRWFRDAAHLERPGGVRRGYLGQLAIHLVRRADERGGVPVLLSGSERSLAELEGQLPARLRARVCGRLRLDPAAPAAALAEPVTAALAGVRDAGVRARVADLLERRGGSGRAVLGPEAVATAVAAGHVHRLYMDRRFDEAGWKCFACGELGVKVPLGCPGCGQPVESVDLAEEMVRGTLATDGGVVPVDRVEGLLRAGGVGARLRY